MRIKATLLMMADSEILSLVPKNKLAQIKMSDQHPMFKAFVVGHEGEATGYLVGVGNIVKKWYRTAIELLHSKIAIGLQLFHGHAATNDTEGRIAIGEVVGKKLKEIAGRLSEIVVCYILPHFKHLPLDVASIEASVDLQGPDQNSLYVADVGGVTGIALGNSHVDTPGFPGATLLGQLQAFAHEKGIDIGYGPPLRKGYLIKNTGQPEPLRLAEEKHARDGND